MTTLNEAAEAAKVLGVQFKAIIAVAEALKNIVDLEQTTKEFTEAKDKALADLKIAQDKLADAEKEYASALNGARDVVEEAKEQAQKIVDQARVDAKALTEAAEKTAQKVADDSKAQADAATELLANLGQQHADLTAKVDAARVQLGAVQSKLNAAEEARRKILGGA